MFVYYVYESLIDACLYETCDMCDTTVDRCSFSATKPSSAVESFRNAWFVSHLYQSLL